MRGLRCRKVVEFQGCAEPMTLFKVVSGQLNKTVPFGIIIDIYLLQFCKLNFLFQVIFKLILLK